MEEKRSSGKKAVSEEEITEFVRILDKKVPLNELRANLRDVAQKRGLAGASLELHFAGDSRVMADYANVYRYAFFGMVPDIDLDPRAKWIDPVPEERKQLFRMRK